MKVAFITRSTFSRVPGGDAIQVMETAKHLRELGIQVSVFSTHEKINYPAFDLLHFFNIIRPADLLDHIKKSGKPFVISPLFVDYGEYDRQYRKGFSGFLFRWFPASFNEYFKTIARWIRARDRLISKSYLWKGQQRSIREILEKAEMVLPNSRAEYHYIKNRFDINFPFTIVPNGINKKLFCAGSSLEKEKNLVICAARIEGIKNQYHLIRALNNSSFHLLLIGQPSYSQQSYYHLCKKIAGDNIKFIEGVTQEELVHYYRRAKVHVLPSWFETCGLASLEAAAMGCNIVVSRKGFTPDYFGNQAFYCDPADPASIYNAIEKAATHAAPEQLQQKILQKYTWDKAAAATLAAYKKIIPAAFPPVPEIQTQKQPRHKFKTEAATR